MKKNVGISISKCLKSAAKNRRANQTARAILLAPTVSRVDTIQVSIRKDNSNVFGVVCLRISKAHKKCKEGFELF
jgi:hypothetical protein